MNNINKLDTPPPPSSAGTGTPGLSRLRSLSFTIQYESEFNLDFLDFETEMELFPLETDPRLVDMFFPEYPTVITTSSSLNEQVVPPVEIEENIAQYESDCMSDLLESSDLFFPGNAPSCPPSTPTIEEMVQLRSHPSVSPSNRVLRTTSFHSSCSKVLFEVNSVQSTTLYRREAIKRWKVKRERRSFRKKIVCKARKDYAETRERKGGRFLKSTAPGWVSITQI